MLPLVLLLAAQSAAPTAPSSPPPSAPSAASTTSTATRAPSEEDAVAALGAGLSSLRAEVDAVAADVARERRAADDDIASLERRRRELEARLAQSELLQRELAARDAALASATREAAQADDVARAPVLEALRALRAHVDRLPYRANGRRERIDAALRAAEGLSPAAGAALVWPIVSDEVALLNETARVRQPIEVGGAPLIAEVAHVGPLVVWKAKDGRTGVAVPDGDRARFVEVTDVEGRQRLLLFFGALQRGTPRGPFLVPNPMAVVDGGVQR